MNIIFFDDKNRQFLRPFTFIRPVSEIRCGILTIADKWRKQLIANYSFLTETYLQEKFPLVVSDNNLMINSALIPNSLLIEEVNSLKEGEILIDRNNILLAYSATKIMVQNFNEEQLLYSATRKVSNANSFVLKNIWEIFVWNEREIKSDFELVTKGRKSQKLSDTNRVFCEENIFVEEGAIVECAIINAKNAKVYIGKDAEIMEGSIIRGSFSIGEQSVLKMGAKIYGATTIGPYSKVGGEVNNSVFFAYSNKAHDGFIGNSVIGEWCNIGADSNNSNLKNNYASVKIWSYPMKSFIDTGLQFCGLFLGDHTKCGINTMFNTGTVIGVSSNIYGSGFPRNFVPSFSWGGALKFVDFQLEKAIEVAEKVYARRDMQFNEVEQRLMKAIFEMTEKIRIENN
ncbi:MAG: GlmU family protein [Bacteroidota bacterium]